MNHNYSSVPGSSKEDDPSKATFDGKYYSDSYFDHGSSNRKRIIFSILYLLSYWILFLVALFAFNYVWYAKLLSVVFIIGFNCIISYFLLQSHTNTINRWKKLSLDENVEFNEFQKTQITKRFDKITVKCTQHEQEQFYHGQFYAFTKKIDKYSVDYILPFTECYFTVPNAETLKKYDCHLTVFKYENYLVFDDMHSGSTQYGSWKHFQNVMDPDKSGKFKSIWDGSRHYDRWELHYGPESEYKSQEVDLDKCSGAFEFHNPLTVTVYRTKFKHLQNSKWKRCMLYILGFTIFGLFDAWFSCFDDEKKAYFKIPVEHRIYSLAQIFSNDTHRNKIISKYIAENCFESLNQSYMDVKFIVYICGQYLYSKEAANNNKFNGYKPRNLNNGKKKLISNRETIKHYVWK